MGQQNCKFLYSRGIHRSFSQEEICWLFWYLLFLTGFAARKNRRKGQPFRVFIASGYEVMKELLLLVMKLAPIGLGAYFAYQGRYFRATTFGFYAKPLGLYYIAGVIYFLVFFSIYAFYMNGQKE